MSLTVIGQTSRNSLPKSQPSTERSSNSPSQPVVLTTAELTKEVLQNNFKYTFISNKPLSADRIAQWESRFKVSFPIIIDITMSAQDQLVQLTLPNSHTSEELLEIVRRFHFSDYQILN
jgi:hypothetical protein